MNEEAAASDRKSGDRPVNNADSLKTRNPYTIWFVVLSFVLPVALAYSMYFFGDIKSFSNSGEILDPIVNITTFGLADEQGEPISGDELTYKWRMISFLGAECDEACRNRIYDSRQVHTSLGKNRHRVGRMFVHLEPPSQGLRALIEQTHPNVIQVHGDHETIIRALGGGAGISSNEIYIMDPMGNVMMRFTAEQPNRDILKDLKKLLKVSQIG